MDNNTLVKIPVILKNRSLHAYHKYSNHPWQKNTTDFVLGAIGCVTLILGYIGFSEYFQSLGQDLSNWDLLYLTLQLFVLQSGSLFSPDGTVAEINLPLSIARLIAPIVPAYAIVRTFSNKFSESIHKIRIYLLPGEVMIIGSNRQARLFAEKFHQEDRRVLLFPDQEDSTLVDFCRSLGLYLMKSERMDAKILNTIRKGKINAVVSVGSDDETNAKIARLLRHCAEYVKGNTISCQVHINNADTFKTLTAEENSDSDYIRIKFLNINTAAASHVLEKYPPIPIRCKSSRRPQQKSDSVLCMVMGSGPLVEPLIIDIIRNWRTRYESKKQKIAIDLVAPGVDVILASVIRTLGSIPDYCALRVTEQHEFDLLDLTDANSLPDYACVYFNYSEDISTILHAEKLSAVARVKDIRLIVCVEERSEIAELLWLRHNRAVSEDNSEAFIIYCIHDEICEPSALPGGADDRIGEEIQRNYEISSSKISGSSDTSAPVEDPNANRAKARQIRHDIASCGLIIEPLMSLKARDFKFSDEDKDKLAEMEHNRWMSQRLAEGWVYGEKKNLETRSNPNLVCWQRLSPDSKQYNLDEIDRYPEYLEKVDKQIRKPTLRK